MSQDYNSTLNLPKTDFPMRAGLPKSEPVMLEKWEKENIYNELMKLNEGKPLFVLHDGPPYANGNIHLGTALNKILKDFIVRYKNMAGFKAPFVPGWDTHGLPTELKARKKAGVGSSADISPLELRKMCEEFVNEYIDDQRNQFKRLGVIGEWDNPYITLTHDFEEEQIKIFAEMACKGYIYKGLKPVYWCPECKTALAEAEIEYAEDPCHSIYVKFNVTDDLGKFSAMGIDPKKVYFVIWTTTTWTLPGNVAICVGPSFDYAIIKSGDEYYVMAEELYKDAMEAAEITDYEVVGTIKGSELEYMKTAHPFMDRESLVIVGDHVTLESGTGCVHTAPGHGVEDYDVCRNYPEIPIIVPVDENGVLTEEAGMFAGLKTEDANKPIAEHLEKIGALFALKKIIHQYPHCWRCKHPVLFRATDQWFCSVDDFKDDAVKAIDEVEWIPGWGKDRITSMVRERKDWCISRQRKWGVPIPIFYCEDCGEPLIDKEAMLAVAELFGKEGSNAWFTYEASEILPSGTKCKKCGCTSFTKEKDIMDVWFDSGSSHAAVLKKRPYLKWPADLYLEGADQYRGWFQSSLLTSVATMGSAPYKAVLTHGWVVDGKGRVMHKSLGNGIEPEEVSAVQDTGIRETELLQRVKQRAFAIIHQDDGETPELDKSVIESALDPKNDVIGTSIEKVNDLAVPEEKEQFTGIKDMDTVQSPAESEISPVSAPVVLPETAIKLVRDRRLKTARQNPAPEKMSPLKMQDYKTEQMMLFGMEDQKSEADNIIGLLEATGVEFVDKRANGGSLWIIGGYELAETVRKAKALGYIFHFKKEGGRATKNKPGWWAK